MANAKTDVLLIGGGIMSVTLGTLIAQLDNSRSVTLVEQAESLGRESSDAWNNAGTGHAGYCELNYTPQDAQGNVAISRALGINEKFELSLQFWSSLAHDGILPSPQNFIRKVPHLSWVKGESGQRFLETRQKALGSEPLFSGMEYSSDPQKLEAWLPLIARGRSDNQPMAATRVDHGSDVNFGTLTRSLGEHLSLQPQFHVHTSTRVIDLLKTGDRWMVTLHHSETGEYTQVDAGFVFIGAGGASLPLLQRAGIKEAKGYGGFPVSGLWLACQNEDLALTHNAKVYSQAEVGAPPMSVPHLDTRFIDGKPALLFGPFAGFTTRFLKSGSMLDLIRSVRPNNLGNLLHIARTQWPLTRYLIKEALSRREHRLAHLDGFMPSANHDEWDLRWAGQRVQIIKTGADGKGALEFGTEVLTTGDRTLAALLGASPGASTCVSAMLDVIEKCLPELTEGHRRSLLQSLIPSYGQSLQQDAQLLRNVRAFTHPTLGLTAKNSSSFSSRSEHHADRNTERNESRRESGRDHSGRRAGVA